jgi:hypothetical protein
MSLNLYTSYVHICTRIICLAVDLKPCLPLMTKYINFMCGIHVPVQTVCWKYSIRKHNYTLRRRCAASRHPTKCSELMPNGTLIEERPMERESRVEYADRRNVWEFTIIWHPLSLSLNASHVSFHTAIPLFVSHLLVAFLVAFTKLRKTTISFLMSSGPHGKTLLPLNAFLSYFMLGGGGSN